MDNPLKRSAAATSEDRPSTQQKMDTTPGVADDVSIATDDDSMLGTVPDTFSEAQCIAMDAGVFGYNATGPTIITIMVGMDKDQVFDRQYADLANVFALISQYPGFSELLEQAGREKSLKAVRNLKILRPPAGPVFYELNPNESHDLEPPYHAFQQDYVGEYHRILIKTMEAYKEHPPFKAYNYSMSIIQASGMGKSRQADKAAEEVFAIPFNIREELGPGVTTYPPADNAVRFYFTPLPADSDDRLQIKYAAFLGQLFEEVTAVLKSWDGEFTSKTWHDYLADGQTSTTVGKNRELLYEKAVMGAQMLLNLNPKQAQVRQKQKKACEDLVKVIRGSKHRAYSMGHLELFVYIDEAHGLTLIPQAVDERTRSAYHILGTVISWLNHIPIFFLFLSTNSNLRAFAPRRAWHPSARITSGLYLFPPYTELPFDVFARGLYGDLVKQKGSVTLDLVCQWDVMVRFGRPLWYSHYHYGNSEHVVMLAESKLSPKGELAKDENAQYAALSCRVMMSFDSMREDARYRESQLVESYMRVAYAISEHREFMRSGYSSEPVLAEAAARLLDPDRKGAIAFEAPNILHNALKAGFLARGERGELVGRVLFIIAHDLAVLDSGPLSEGGPIFHKPIRLLDFLSHLYHKDWHAVVFDARPVSNPDGITLREAFKDAWIHFSHCALAGDSEAITVNNLWKTLLRGCFFQCKDNQYSIDMISIVMFGKPNTVDIKTAKKGILCAQIKNRVTVDEVHVDPTVANPPEGTPVLSLIMELGVRTGPWVRAVSREPPGLRSGSGSPHDNHYSIVSHGATSETYSAILPEVNDTYNALLMSSKIIDDFPRKDSLNVDALKRMKPAFHGDAKSQDTSWDFV